MAYVKIFNIFAPLPSSTEFNNLFITDCPIGCKNDNLECSQWQKIVNMTTFCFENFRWDDPSFEEPWDSVYVKVGTILYHNQIIVIIILGPVEKCAFSCFFLYHVQEKSLMVIYCQHDIHKLPTTIGKFLACFLYGFVFSREAYVGFLSQCLYQNLGQCMFVVLFMQERMFCSCTLGYTLGSINTLRPRQNGCHFPYNIFKCIFVNV